MGRVYSTSGSSILIRKSASAMEANVGGGSVARAVVNQKTNGHQMVHAGHAAGHGTHAQEDPCPCAETSGTVVAMRHVPGFRVIENHYPAGLELPRHFHDHA